jgi:peptide deformylase
MSERIEGRRPPSGTCSKTEGGRCVIAARAWFIGPKGRVSRFTASCLCGNRFKVGRDEAELPISLDKVNENIVVDAGLAGIANGASSVLWPERMLSPWAKEGIVPVGVTVLHRPTSFVDPTSRELRSIVGRLLERMEACSGIGVAANQVGAPFRIFVHRFPRAAPHILINPVLLGTSGSWRYVEGCLSLQLKGVEAEVVRPDASLIVATSLSSGPVVLATTGLLSRVIQHELDHLDGIEYVQRLGPPNRDQVYGIMKSSGIDIRMLPPVSYPESAFAR